jgi:hypothetical protein
MVENRSIAFHDKSRTAASFIGLEDDLLRHSPELMKRCKAEQVADGFEIISRFRNRIVHQGKPFEYQGLELHDVWNISQWLFELFFFYCMGYRGQMYDRRHRTGWVEPTKSVPLS